MAYKTSDNYKKFIYDEDSKQSLKIVINNKTIDSDYIRSFTITDEIFENDVFSLGSAVSCKITVELNNEVFDEIQEKFEAMEVSFILETDVGNETIPLGEFLIKEKDESSSYYTKFTLYDYMNKFDVEFDASQIVPCTRFELLKEICNYCGVGLENESILNGEELVNVYDNTITAKTYLSLISERAGGFAKINRNGNLEIKTFSDVDCINLPESKIGDYTVNDLKTITKIVYQNAIQKFEKGTDDGSIIFLSQDSPFSCSQNEVDKIFEKLNGLQFQTLDVRVWGDPSIDTGDLITFGGYKSFAQKNWKFGNGFYGNYKTILNQNDDSSLQISKIPSTAKRKKIETRLDEDETKITMLIEENDGNKKRLTKIEQDNESIKQTVEETTETVNEVSKNVNDAVNTAEQAYANAEQTAYSLQNDYYNQEQIDAMQDATKEDLTLVKNSVVETQTSTQAQIDVIQEEINNGVSKVVTTTGTFDSNGLHIQKVGEAMNSILDWDGLVVRRDQTEVLTVRSAGVETENLTVRKYLTVKPIRLEQTKSISDGHSIGLGFFFTGV